ncbi:hypothetical protein LCGC14_2457210 [marine sediment metagenome]|uniref:Uncharacterized protein n=1 Tax=marine sediment metagenome TaxID=412755 RepID=A0A0F9DRI9_9ZZZZ
MLNDEGAAMTLWRDWIWPGIWIAAIGVAVLFCLDAFSC